MGIRKGFTLAEVLIPLVIIGVIGAITIPSLMNKTNEQDTVVAVKKAYSTLSQAYQRVVAENGEINPSALGSDETEATKTFGEMFVKQLNVQKVCGMEAGGDCYPNVMYKLFNGSDWSNFNNSSTDFKIRLSDGMSVSMYIFSAFQNYGESQPLSNMFGFINVDINGDKTPNTLGKDVFQFYVTKYGLVPLGIAEDTHYPLSTCFDLGSGCATWVLTKGNVDYWHKDISW